MRNVMRQATTHMAVNSLSGGTAMAHHGNVTHLAGAKASMNSASMIDAPEARAISA